jgi:DnaJ-class molecular chaperone
MRKHQTGEPCIRCGGKGYIGEHKAPCSNCAPMGVGRSGYITPEDKAHMTPIARCKFKGKGDGRKQDKRFGDAAEFKRDRLDNRRGGRS